LHHLLLAGLPAHFESHMPSHAVWSLWAMSGLRNNYAQERPAVNAKSRRSLAARRVKHGGVKLPIKAVAK